MAWLAQYPGSSEIERQAKRAISLQLTLAAPLWLAVGATASAGLWLMNRWTSATNLEAALAPRVAPAGEAPRASLIEIIVEPVVEGAPEPAPVAPDDLTRLVGIGPKVAAALAERGVTRYAHLAAWTVDDMAKFDADLKLLGRGTRDAWIAQAKRLASEG